MNKKRNKNRHGKRGTHRKTSTSNSTEDSPYYAEYLNDPIALLEDGRYELLLEWEARRDGYESVEAMLEEQRQMIAARTDDTATLDEEFEGQDSVLADESPDDLDDIPF